jgi:hypothetical protein
MLAAAIFSRALARIVPVIFPAAGVCFGVVNYGLEARAGATTVVLCLCNFLNLSFCQASIWHIRSEAARLIG